MSVLVPGRILVDSVSTDSQLRPFIHCCFKKIKLARRSRTQAAISASVQGDTPLIPHPS